jgi:hypothetical protein
MPEAFTARIMHMEYFAQNPSVALLFGFAARNGAPLCACINNIRIEEAVALRISITATEGIHHD